MTEDREKTLVVLLRILGILLILVGVTMLAQQVRSETAFPLRIAQSIVSGGSHDAPRCERSVVHVRKIKLAGPPPAPPAPPAAPAPPAPPLVLSF